MRIGRKVSGVIASLLLATSAVGAEPADTEPLEEDGYILTEAWANPAECNSRDAERMTLRDVVKRGVALKGRCVSVDGYWRTNALFRRLGDANARDALWSDDYDGGRVGLYARKELRAKAPTRGSDYTIVGIVGDCATEWPDAIMIMGYCHQAGGPIIRVSEVLPRKSQGR